MADKPRNVSGRGQPTLEEQNKLKRQNLLNKSLGAAPGGVHIGGSFAPPLDAEKLVAYKKLAEDAPAHVRDEMNKLIKMMEVFSETPRSRMRGSPHPVGVGTIVPLEAKEVERIWDHVPWDGQQLSDGWKAPRECDMLAEIFEGISNATHKPLRDAAFHLLWFAKELTRDREPLTNDQL